MIWCIRFRFEMGENCIMCKSKLCLNDCKWGNSTKNGLIRIFLDLCSHTPCHCCGERDDWCQLVWLVDSPPSFELLLWLVLTFACGLCCKNASTDHAVCFLTVLRSSIELLFDWKRCSFCTVIPDSWSFTKVRSSNTLIYLLWKSNCQAITVGQIHVGAWSGSCEISLVGK